MSHKQVVGVDARMIIASSSFSVRETGSGITLRTLVMFSGAWPSCSHSVTQGSKAV